MQEYFPQKRNKTRYTVLGGQDISGYCRDTKGTRLGTQSYGDKTFLVTAETPNEQDSVHSARGQDISGYYRDKTFLVTAETPNEQDSVHSARGQDISGYCRDTK